MGGVINKDTEIRVIPKGQMLNAENVRIVSPEGGNNRSVKPVKGTTLKTALSLGTDPVCIGLVADTLSNTIYWAACSDEGGYICSYNVDTDTETIILTDTRAASSNVLSFTKSMNVDMRFFNDNDNGKNFLFFTDGVNEPKYFDVADAETWSDSNFPLINVSLIKYPPPSAPTFVLSNDGTGINFIEDKFIQFAYRYKYRNGEYSALSPFSAPAFLPKTFNYEYLQASNKSMINQYNTVTLTYEMDFQTNSNQPSDVEIVYKEARSNTIYIAARLNLDELNITSNGTEEFVFDNSNISGILDPQQALRLYDNVPIKAETIEIIKNRVVFGDYTENYDVSTPVMSLDVVSTSADDDSTTEGSPHVTVKSNRDYEVAIAYLDGKGRMTTPLTSTDATVHVPASAANKKNVLQVTIDKDYQGPTWATKFRFFIKESRSAYDVIAPITFYREGRYAWIKLEGDNKNKVSEGDVLIVKSDTSGLASSPAETRVIEIASKERNFLETDSSIKDGEDTLQQAGLYMRLDVSGFSLSEDAVKEFSKEVVSQNASGIQGLISSSDYVETPIFTGEGLDDLTLTTGNTFTHDEDIRYTITISDGTASPNEFTIEEHVISGASVGKNTSSATAMTGSPQNCEVTADYGVQIEFAATTGHTTGDKWVISCKSSERGLDYSSGGPSTLPDRALAVFQGKEADDESIIQGATIILRYDDSASSGNVTEKLGFFEDTFVSTTNYANIEEWFYGDEILTGSTDITWPTGAGEEKYIMFRRGTIGANGRITVTTGGTDPLHLLIGTSARRTSSATAFAIVTAEVIVRELENPIIMETKAKVVDNDIFYELPTTYSLSGELPTRYHQGKNANGDTDQDSNDDAVISLVDFYNAFGWYNGFESIKIEDSTQFNTLLTDGRASAPVTNYAQTRRIASLTYSDVYEGTTNFNGFNEFNLADSNFKDLDSKYGNIRVLHSTDSDLEVYQHDKTQKVLFGKDLLVNADGTTNVGITPQVLGQELLYNGDYGITNQRLSWAVFGGRRYHIDLERGVLLRLSQNGYTEISMNGMHDFFRTNSFPSTVLGVYDPYNDEYLVQTSSSMMLGFSERATEGGGFTSFYSTAGAERFIALNNRLYAMKDSQIWLMDDSSTRNTFFGGSAQASKITTVLNDAPGEVKTFRAIALQTDSDNWDMDFSTNLPNTSGSIDNTEWEYNEGEYYAYLRQNENTSDITSSLFVFQGVGTVSGSTSTTVTVSTPAGIPRAYTKTDSIYHNDGGTLTLIGVATGVTSTATTVVFTFASLASTPTSGDLIVFGKDRRTEGEPIKGSYLKIDLENTGDTDWELFGYHGTANKSFD